MPATPIADVGTVTKNETPLVTTAVSRLPAPGRKLCACVRAVFPSSDSRGDEAAGGHDWCQHVGRFRRVVARERRCEAAPPDKTPPESGPASEDVDPFRSPPADGGPAASSGNPFESPPPHGLPNIPGVRLKKITEDYVELVEDSEPAIVRDVTVGGIMLLPNGHLKRTYSGKPPALCPT